jgi:hypothetical protein
MANAGRHFRVPKCSVRYVAWPWGRNEPGLRKQREIACGAPELPNQGSNDEVWFNPGDGLYFVAEGQNSVAEQRGIVSSFFLRSRGKVLMTDRPKPGRPWGRSHDVGLHMRVDAEFLLLVADWIDHQPDPKPRRTEAIRQLVRRGYYAPEPRQPDGIPIQVQAERKRGSTKRRRAHRNPAEPGRVERSRD